MIFKLVDGNNQTVIQTKVKVSLNTFILKMKYMIVIIYI